MCSLTASINELQSLVTSLDSFNAQHWSIRYPQFAVQPTGTAANAPPSPPSLQRAHSTEQHVQLQQQRPSLQARSFTSGFLAEKAEGSGTSKSKDMSILSLLDIKTGEYATGSNSLPALLPSLSQATLAQLLTRRFATALKHLDSLRVRVQDTDSKVLVTGDLNAGKSTFVNALTRRDVMPVDQQPCTSVFTELVDSSFNNGKEEAHAIKAENLAKYKPEDESTFTRFAMEQLDDACIDGHEEGYTLVRVYISSSTKDSEAESTDLPPFVHNGIVDISLIDAPGLNRDTLSTTALFSRQSEIDVVVFLVSAENHFTLSAKEFLWNAAREKAYVFVVVNKFDGIKDKARCVKRVGEQLKQLSPATWDARAELVHFVEAAHPADQPAWTELERSLREFVLQKRSISKLLPAKTYLLNLLSDLDLLADSNMAAADAQLQKALADLEVLRPAHEKLERAKDAVGEELHSTEEGQVEDVQVTTKTMLDRAIAAIGHGELPTPSQENFAVHPSVKRFNAPDHLPAYPGLLSIWSWAEDIKTTLLQSLEGSLRDAEEYARNKTIEGVQHITGHLADTFLPSNGAVEAKTEKRVFRPEVMFAKHRKARLMSPYRGVASLGLSTSHRPAESTSVSSTKDIEVSFLDLFDLECLWPHLSATGDAKLDDAETMGAVSVSTIGVGALTMFGSRAVGVQSFVESIAKVADFAGSKTVRKWAGPVVGVLSKCH